VAAVDGYISPEEITALQKLYKMLDLDPDTVHGDVHALSTPSSRDRLATVVRADTDRREYKIPPEETKEAGEGDSAELDMDAVRSILADTSTVAALLGDIFDDDEESVESPTAVDHAVTIAGLDARHSALLLKLQGVADLEREEFEAWAEELALLPQGALDTINDAAWDACDDPLIEGEETLEVSATVMEELLA
jgi:hypothetical protein